ncbi:protein of unknown function [Taphrina deformans PYCC 5710]|uniref:Uncharacterized protein n=1 Tax=Taphrina deformans (strain PYCC 5710 / ATCC 11124 / CBS 356.35 / IMI 108563 / JCM 9778 / NBRC 8474) TaxID=1097556 RepID=R4XH44_TAPDE|nr:protein of unknown function [Taphrina deformans PYCC 5710]|eukprot:CCG83843.1 protein of unknown function [Taphrina deformans PYCC 5710]
MEHYNNNLITDHDASVINDLGIAAAGMSLLLVFTMLCVLGHRTIRHFPVVRSNFGAVSSRILHVSLILSLIYSASFIITCSGLASNQTSCNVAMWAFLVSLHVMNGLCAAILLHCALLLTCKNLRLSTLLVRLSIALVVLGAFALGTAGLIAGRYGYNAEQNTCWITAPPNKTSRYAGYKMMAILFFITLLCVWYHLNMLRRTVDLDLSKSKSLILRVSFPPAVMSLHCLMTIGGDLPITYHSRAGQYTSYLFNYVGLGSFGFVLALCAIFIDPAFRNIVRLTRATTESRKSPEDGHLGEAEEIQVQSTQKDEILQASLETLDDEKNAEKIAGEKVLHTEAVTERTDSTELSNEEKVSFTTENQEVVDPGGRRPSVRSGSVVKWPSDLLRRVSDSHVCTPDGDCCIFIV